ncbi:MAG: hypothetical protein EOO54_14820 [Haliea sp.]|nr:MAG: hypothetical protein EOO54_14820 [Haliea sp.]
MTAGGAITQTGAITANALTAKTLVNAGAAITLNNASNDVATVDLRARNAADTANVNGALSYRDANGFDVAGVSTGGALTLQSNGNITQSGAITAASLSVPGTGSGSLRLDTQANNITALNAITAAAGFALNNGNNSVAVNGALTTINSAVAIDAGTGTYAQANVDINAGTGPITVTADTVNITTNTLNNAMGTSGVLTIKAKSAGRAMSLGAAGAGFDLLTTEITSLSAGATGPIVIGDAASTGVMTIGAAVNLAGKTLTLNAGAITDSGSNVITAANLTLNANGQIGTDGSNGIDVAASKLNVNTTSGGNAFVRSGAISFGVGTEGSSVAGTLDLTATGNVTQTAGTGNIAAGTLKVKTLSAGTATVALTNAGNDVAAVQLQSRNAGDTGDAAGALQYTDTNGFDVVALSTTGDATLSAGGGVTQSGAINAAGLALMGSGGAYTLRHAGNAVTTLAANTGSMDYSQAGALAVGPVAGVPGVTTTGAAKLETTGAASDLTLNQAITSAATGDAIVLKAGSSNAAGVAGGGRFVNHAGTSGLVAASGRYLVYSGDPGTTTEGVTGYSKRYNTGAAFTPAGSASMFLYRVAPTLTISSDNASRTYGQANPVFTGSASGYIDGDTAASVGVTRSSSAVFNTPVAAGPAAITSGATNHENYTLVLGDGLLTIERAPISSVNGITANDKLADGSTQATLNTGGAIYAGIVAGDVLTASATGNFDTPSPGAGKLVFVKGITLGGTAANNYTLLQNTAVTRASISELPRTPVVQPLTVAGLSAAARMPLARTGSEGLAVPPPPSVLDANALIEQLPTASGGCQAQGSGCLTVRTVREATVRVPGLMSVTLARGVTGFQFSLPTGLLASMPASGEPLEVSTLGGRPLPPWLTYDAATGTFTVGTPPAGALPLQIRLGAGNRSVILTIEESPRNVAAR